MKRTYESKRHHWWPSAISGYWADGRGMVTQVLAGGKAVTGAPWTFGHDKHTHNIRFSGPWNSSFESMYGKADNSAGTIIDWLSTLDARRENCSGGFSERLLAQPMTRERRGLLAEVLASLIVRSPLMRHRIARRVEGARDAFPSLDITADTSIVAANMQPLLAAFTRRMQVTGKFAVLLSEDRELIFGDGFFSTFPTNGHVSGFHRCIIPITPSMAVLYTSPFRYVSNCELATMMLRSDEVDFLNLLVQVYSRDRIFYRSDRPVIHDAFMARQHMQLTGHSNAELDWLFRAVADFADRPLAPSQIAWGRHSELRR